MQCIRMRMLVLGKIHDQMWRGEQAETTELASEIDDFIDKLFSSIFLEIYIKIYGLSATSPYGILLSVGLGGLEDYSIGSTENYKAQCAILSTASISVQTLVRRRRLAGEIGFLVRLGAEKVPVIISAYWLLLSISKHLLFLISSSGNCWSQLPPNQFVIWVQDCVANWISKRKYLRGLQMAWQCKT